MAARGGRELQLEQGGSVTPHWLCLSTESHVGVFIVNVDPENDSFRNGFIVTSLGSPGFFQQKNGPTQFSLLSPSGSALEC